MQEHGIPMEYIGMPTSLEMEQERLPEEPQFQIMSTVQEILVDTNGKINPVKVADKITRENSFLYCAGSFLKYQDGVYKYLDENEVKKIIKDILKNRYTLNRGREVMESMKADTFLLVDDLNNTGYLNLQDGLFDLETFELGSHTPEVYSTIQLDVSHDTKASCRVWRKTVNEIFLGSQEKIEVLQEFFGLCFTKESKYEKALICIGDGANGKSVVLHVLQKLLGEENYSAVPLERFDNSHYLADLFGRLANISVETNARSSVYDSTFKQIVSGDPIQADAKYKKPIKFRPFCKLVFALNNMPRVDDKTDAFFRRLIILRFSRAFKEEDQNKNLKHELEEELDGIFQWSLIGLRRLRDRGHFRIPEDLRIEVDEYRKQNNNVLLFVGEECSIHWEAEISKDNLYQHYQHWCTHNGYKAFSKGRFGKELKKQYEENLDERRTSKDRIWVGIGHIKEANYTSDDVSDINDTDVLPF